jgi:hypothetical protein
MTRHPADAHSGTGFWLNFDAKTAAFLTNPYEKSQYTIVKSRMSALLGY